jgi:hypothetical protein
MITGYHKPGAFPGFQKGRGQAKKGRGQAKSSVHELNVKKDHTYEQYVNVH